MGLIFLKSIIPRSPLAMLTLGKSKMFQKGPGDCLQPFLLDSLRPSCKGHRLGKPLVMLVVSLVNPSPLPQNRAPDLAGLRNYRPIYPRYRFIGKKITATQVGTWKSPSQPCIKNVFCFCWVWRYDVDLTDLPKGRVRGLDLWGFQTQCVEKSFRFFRLVTRIQTPP